MSQLLRFLVVILTTVRVSAQSLPEAPMGSNTQLNPACGWARTQNSELKTQQCPPVLLNCSNAPVEYCDNTTNSPNYWNTPDWHDPLHNRQDLAETPVNLQVRLLDSCQTGNVSVRYVLRLDLDGNGTRETIVDSDDLPGWNTVLFNNAQSAGTARSFDHRAVSANQRYGFALQTTWSGDTLTAAVRWNTESAPGQYVQPELPLLGKNASHRIEWTITAGGEAYTCAWDFKVLDCKKPTVACLQGLAVNMLPSQKVTLHAFDFLLSATDNITPLDQIVLGIQRAGAGTDFPVNPDGSPRLTVDFGCLDLGEPPVEVWALDKAGNAAFCETTLRVQDSHYNCGDPSTAPVCVSTYCSQTPVADVAISFNVVKPGNPKPLDTTLLGYTFVSGCFNIPYFPTAGNFTIQADRNTDPLNGVSTQDLVLIQQHILGIKAFEHPWQYIAADANNSQTVTTFDIVELRSLILGVHTKLPNNASWRFIPESYTLPAPNPLAHPIPSQVHVSSGQIRFNGIKIGDLNCNTSLDGTADTRSRAAVSLPEAFLAAGQKLETALRLPAEAAWSGLQFALHYNPDQIELEAVEPGNLPGLDPQCYAQPVPGMLNVSWASGIGQPISAGTAVLRLRWRAKTALRLSDALRFDSERLQPEAYAADTRAHGLDLVFGDQPAAPAPTAVFAPQPNPTDAGARLAVQLPEPQTVGLWLFDAAGRLVLEQQSTLPAGLHWLDLPALAFPGAGIYFWQIQTGTLQQAGRLVRR